MLLDAPPLARAPGTDARIASEQRAFRRELAADVPGARIGWRYRLVANGYSLSLPSSDLTVSVRCPACVTSSPPEATGRSSASSPQQIGAPALWGSTLDTAGQGVKIGIIDSGIDPDHPYFDPTGYTMPPGFPKGQQRFTTAKVIVARVFAPKSGATAPSARLAFSEDDSSHGTHVAGIAAGNADTATGQGRISGVAPRAYLGNYKVFVETDSGLSPNANSPAIVAAIEAAVADGMDVDQLLGRRAGDRAEPGHRRARARCRRRSRSRAGGRGGERLQRLRRRLGLVAGQLGTGDQRRRRRDQPDDAHACGVLVRRPDDDLAAAQAGRRRARRRRALLRLGRRLGRTLRDEHGGAARRGRCGPPAPASPGVDGRTGQVCARPVRRRLGRESQSHGRPALPGRRRRRTDEGRRPAGVRRADRGFVRPARARSRRDEDGCPHRCRRRSRDVAGHANGSRPGGREALASGDGRRARRAHHGRDRVAQPRRPATSTRTSSCDADRT